MTTLRNLKPHYAEPKGKSGPVIVVKKGEVMSEPTTEAGRRLRRFCDSLCDGGMTTEQLLTLTAIAADVEAEARDKALNEPNDWTAEWFRKGYEAAQEASERNS